MSKTWETKRRILQLLSGKSKTLSILSQELDLAPSTVSEHIEQLETMGAVRKVDNPFIKKWKYYEKNPEFDQRGAAKPMPLPVNNTKLAVGLALVAGLIALFAIGMTLTSGVPGAATVGFLITDPPHVPAGTQALNVTYSSLQAYVVVPNNSSASGWINGTGSGVLDLMTLINATQTIGAANIPANAVISEVRFAITSAAITINGTTYNAIVPSGNLTATVTGRAASNTSILLDLSPTVVSIFTNDSAAFVLVPSVKAVLVGNESLKPIGEKSSLDQNENNHLSTTPGISITNAVLSVSGNTTTLSVTVKNNANQSVVIKHVTLFGIGPNAIMDSNAVANIGDNINGVPLMTGGIGTVPNPSLGLQDYGNGDSGNSVRDSANTSAGGYGLGMGMGARDDGHMSVNAPGINASVMGIAAGMFGNGNQGNEGNGQGHMFVPFAANVNGNITVSPMVISNMLGVLNFLVAPNGTLVLPFVGACGPAGTVCIGNGNKTSNGNGMGLVYEGEGYALASGASATFTFSGQITYANGRIVALPESGKTWTLAVTGEDGVQAETNVTSS